ncbi:MAG: stage III sporulation protein AA [Sulfobacillus thermosulfidooxidans]|uniref:AAA+ ATPase domain-containing protein n=1 Tax=Sulfobacillus thermotolerans TaxID=338644 RepID=A0ABN5GYT3_9FIRM|nr:ATPase, T2SS/T4P/T4SS family [Sulfobacillus sp. hq2]AUW93514.1 hypothetical protein BXT84_05785 [Sulfobacillus thermotolerans]MCY0908854.1 ATPase, T2SS/T4P/T4SS family [Sulfobacillus thermotolerans]POB10757.1 stage III sporulation protein AA [Sulfobacillus sp. hq2]PSR36096.1 MAG: stage III sporulation protein AA [Sulfobacillus thermosulfidooxidans]
MEPWDFLPRRWKEKVQQLGPKHLANVEEVRFRLDRPVLCYGPNWSKALGDPEHDVLRQQDLDELVSILADHSLYARVEELRHAYLTLPGGHRVGIAGRAVWRDGVLSTMTDITGLNFRRAQDVYGAAQKVLNLFDTTQPIPSLLIAAPPRCGKTTLLRDLARHLSDGGERVAVVDERSELAGFYRGHYGFWLGMHTDVLDAWPKAEGIMAAIRTLGPDWVVVDEIGGPEDLQAVARALQAGVGVLASIHAGSYQQLEAIADPDLKGIRVSALFPAVAVISRRFGPGTVEELWQGHQQVWRLAS